MSLREQHEALEARMAAIRQRAEAEGRKLTADEAAQFAGHSVERAAVYRAWQQERLRTEPSNIIEGAAIFRQSSRKRQLQRWALVIGVIVILGALRYERATDRRDAGAGFTPADAQELVDYGLTGDQRELLRLLPAGDALPEGFEIGGEWGETLDEVAWEWEESSERRLQMLAWGFEDAVYRYYVLPDELMTAGADGLYDLDVELIEYGSREQALDAAEFDHAEALALAGDDPRTAIEVNQPIGDLALALQEPFVTYGAELSSITLWVVDGPLQYRFWSIAAGPGLPPALLEIARDTIAQE